MECLDMEYAGEAAMQPGLSTGTMNGHRAGWSESTFEAVFFEYYARMVAVLCRIVGDRAQAEELASDTFLKLYERPSSPERYQNVGGWLYRTATRLALDSLRSLNRRRRYDPDAGERLARSASPADPLDQMIAAERSKNVRAALAALKPLQAQALALRASGLAYKEVAAALGVKPTSVGRLLARAEEAFEKAYRRVEKGPRSGLLGSLR
jgi:RNA polymerase sigma-70 factor (ECF subfamily)